MPSAALTVDGDALGSRVREAWRPRRLLARGAETRRVEDPSAVEVTMYPGMLYWWKVRHYGGEAGVHAGRCGYDAGYARRGCGPAYEASGRFGDAGLGVRRPLRFLAFKLELDEKQVAELAK